MHTIEVVNDILVRRVGDGDARKLLCLHGFADSGLMFLPLSETALPDYFELALVDLPGFGGSPSKPGIALIQDYARTIAKLVKVISHRESVGLVGHAYRALKVPSLYYWSEATTPARTRQFIDAYSIPNRRYAAESHWPTIAGPEATANAIVEFILSVAEQGPAGTLQNGAAEL